ncbi:TetR/AcrR family transcriptional regulator [Pseudarthrobacter sp. NPDC058329]|uniref:TetR/AcrR family transcriptional regulator n=1 Tax=Pseudarthrobacter sp. NPDC058329 TaxID=3346448 RepID=UPI0036DA1F64
MVARPRTTTSSIEQATRIIDVAADLFAAKGFHGASMRDIAGQFGLNPGNLYVHIGSKEQILQTIVDFVLGELEQNLREVQALDADPITAVKLIARGRVKVHSEHPHRFAVYKSESRHLTGDALRNFIESRTILDRGLQDILERGEKLGIFREIAAPLAGYAFVENLDLVFAKFGQTSKVPLHTFADKYVDYLFNGWLARPECGSRATDVTVTHESTPSARGLENTTNSP